MLHRVDECPLGYKKILHGLGVQEVSESRNSSNNVENRPAPSQSLNIVWRFLWCHFLDPQLMQGFLITQGECIFLEAPIYLTYENAYVLKHPASDPIIRNMLTQGLRMYCIDRAGVPESQDPHAFYCLWSYNMQILVKIGWIVKQYGLPPLNINTKASVSMQYILKNPWSMHFFLWKPGSSWKGHFLIQ